MRDGRQFLIPEPAHCYAPGTLVIDWTREGDAAMSETVRLKSPEDTQIERDVTEYLTAMKGWKQGEFRVEVNGLSKDGSCAIVWAVFLEDERNPVPGAGRSVEIEVERKTRQVLREFAFQ